MSRLISIGDVTLRAETWDPLNSKSDEPFHYIDISSVDRESKEVSATQLILPCDAPSRARQIVKTGDILVSTVRPNLNAVAEIPEQLDGATASTGYCVLRPDNERVDSRYLYFWVRSSGFVKEMVKRSTGASYPAVSDKIVKDSKLPLPPLPEQKRIAAILDKADSIRRKRQEAVRLTEELLRSVFLDMFGDPVTNPKGWEKAAIKEFGTVMTGNTPSREIMEYYGEYIEWIKSDNINTPNHYLTEAKEYLSVEGQKVGRFVPPGSILVTCIAGSPECIGNAALSNRPVAFNQQINAIIPFDSADSFFLYSQILVAKKLIQIQSTESMKEMVSKGKFENIPLIKPPIELQRQFGSMFRRVEALSKKNSTAYNDADTLFNSLLQRAFKGEL